MGIDPGKAGGVAKSKKKVAGKPAAPKAPAAKAKPSAVSRAREPVAKRTARAQLSGPRPGGAKASTPAPRIANPAVKAPVKSAPIVVSVAAPAAPAEPKRKLTNLSAKDLDYFRSLLIRKRVEILGNVSTMQSEAAGNDKSPGGSSDLSTVPLHPADLGSDNFEREMTISLLEGEKSLLRDIDEALDRVRQGTYGLCLATGEPIGKPRLTAQPWAKYSYEYMLRQEGGRRFRY